MQGGLYFEKEKPPYLMKSCDIKQPSSNRSKVSKAEVSSKLISPRSGSSRFTR